MIQYQTPDTSEALAKMRNQGSKTSEFRRKEITRTLSAERSTTCEVKVTQPHTLLLPFIYSTRISLRIYYHLESRNFTEEDPKCRLSAETENP